MKTIKVEVVSAEERIFSGSARFVSVPGELGVLGILYGHTPLISRLCPGMMRIEIDAKTEELIFVAGGILEVQPRSVTVLADTAIRSKDLDEEKAKQAKILAEQSLKAIKVKIDYVAVQTVLACSSTQKINTLKKFRQGTK